MANKLKNEVQIEIGEKSMTLLPSFACLVAIETRSGKSLVQLVEEFAQQRGTLTDMLIVIEEGTKASGDKVGRDELVELFEEHGVLSMQQQKGLGQFFGVALYGGPLMPEEDEDAKKKSRKPQEK